MLYSPHVANKITGAIDGNLSANIGYVRCEQERGKGKMKLLLWEEMGTEGV